MKNLINRALAAQKNMGEVDGTDVLIGNFAGYKDGISVLIHRI